MRTKTGRWSLPRSRGWALAAELGLPGARCLRPPRARRDAGRTIGDRGCRALNVVLAATGLILAAPLMAVIAALIKLTSPGPVLFTQVRVGVDRRRGSSRLPGDGRRQDDRGGRPFHMYKFRTMEHRDETTSQKWAAEEESRVTPIGRWLRKFRLDELPQLYNVLRGDMNIVGPRPEQPEIFQRLRREVPRYDDRQQVLPGITGLAQIELGYDRSVEDVRRKVSMDLRYIERRSVAEDLRILLKTVPVVVFGRGAI